MMQLEGEFLAGLHGHPLDLVERGVFEYVYDPQGRYTFRWNLVTSRSCSLKRPTSLFHLLGMGSIADQQCIGSVNNDEVMDTYETNIFSRCMDKIIARGKELRLPDISFRIMLFDIIKSLECSEIAPCGVQGYDSNPF